LINALQQYTETAAAMLQGAAKKEHVLAMIEHVEPLLLQCKDQCSSNPQASPDISASFNPGDRIKTEVEKSVTVTGTSNRTTRQRRQWLLTTDASSPLRSGHSSHSSNSCPSPSPRLVDLLSDSDDAEAEADIERVNVPASPGKQFRVAPCVDTSGSVLLGSPNVSPEVFLHVYEVGVLSPSVHKVLQATLGTGAFHVGVEVYGRELSYGNTADNPGDVTGVSMHPIPREHPSHRYCRSINLGCTQLSPTEIMKLLEELRVLWPARNYHTLRNNCVSFAEDFCARLGVQAPPAHVGALAKGLKGFFWD